MGVWGCPRDESEGLAPVVAESGTDDPRGSAEAFCFEVTEQGDHRRTPRPGLPKDHAVPQAGFRILRPTPPDPERFLCLPRLVVHTFSLPPPPLIHPGFVAASADAATRQNGRPEERSPQEGRRTERHLGSVSYPAIGD